MDSILFSLLILRGLNDSQGRTWRCHPCQMYVVEVTLPDTQVSVCSMASGPFRGTNLRAGGCFFNAN